MNRFLTRLAAGLLLLTLSAAAYAEGNPIAGSDRKEADQKQMEQGGKIEEPKADEHSATAELKKPSKTGKSRQRRKENTQSGAAPPPRTHSMPVDPN